MGFCTLVTFYFTCNVEGSIEVLPLQGERDPDLKISDRIEQTITSLPPWAYKPNNLAPNVSYSVR